MKGVYRLKYKMHRLVNMSFYLLFLIGGYLLGRCVDFGQVIEKIKDVF